MVGQLQLIEVLAAALGRSGVTLGRLPVSSCELVRRLTSMGQAAPPLSTQLTQALQAARPALVAAAQQVSAQGLGQASVSGLLQLMAQNPELQVGELPLKPLESRLAGVQAPVCCGADNGGSIC